MAPTAMAAGTFRTTDRVNLRSEPSTESAAILVVNAGTNVEVLEHDPAGWSKVQTGNSTGYIRSDFLKFPIGNTAATFKTTDGVNIRSAASTESSVVGTVIKGTSVEVTEHDPAGWSKVKADGKSGFIRSDFLTRGTGNLSTTTVSSSSNEVIATLKTTGTVNMRSGPSTDTTVIRSLAANTSVDVLEKRSDGWSKVRHNNTDGFIKSDLITETGTSSSPSLSLKTTGTVNMRSGPSTNNSVLVTLAPNTGVEVLNSRQDGWSNVKYNGTNGYIRSDLLSATGSSTLLRTVTDVNLRSGPSTNYRVLRALLPNTVVEVLEKRTDGWSKVNYNGTEGFIKSEFLGAGARVIELIDWATARNILTRGQDMRVVDVRTGISYTIRAFSLGRHADVDTVTQADTDAMLRARGGVWSWSARPVWVTVGDRTFAASMNGMPHQGSAISGNGVSGHFCLHFQGSRSHNVSDSSSYVRNLQLAVTEAYDKRP